MPIYEYRCPKGVVTEKRVTSYNQSMIHCPHCGRLAVRVEVYPDQGVLFNGPGFTRTSVKGSAKS